MCLHSSPWAGGKHSEVLLISFSTWKNISKPWKTVKMCTSVYWYCSSHPSAQFSEMTSISLDSCGLFFLIFLMVMLPIILHHPTVLLSFSAHLSIHNWSCSLQHLIDPTYFLTTHLCSTGSKCLPLLFIPEHATVYPNNCNSCTPPS